jgi:hypothetical protein
MGNDREISDMAEIGHQCNNMKYGYGIWAQKTEPPTGGSARETVLGS